LPETQSGLLAVEAVGEPYDRSLAIWAVTLTDCFWPRSGLIGDGRRSILTSRLRFQEAAVNFANAKLSARAEGYASPTAS